MRVALVSEHASPLAAIGGADAGGQNVHVRALADGIAALGHEVVVHTRRDSPDLADVVDAGPGVRVHHVDAGPAVPLPKDELPEHMPAFAEHLGRFWGTWRPDIVHSHFWMSGAAALDVAGPCRLPVAHTFHALGTVKRRHQGLADTSPRSRLEAERRVAGGVDRILATCTDEVAELTRMGVPTARVSVVPCGVDVEAFTPEGPAEPRRPGLRRLLVLGRVVPRKGIDDVIRALRAVPDTELLVAGGPPVEALDDDEEITRLRRVAHSNGVADRVEFLGSIGRHRVAFLIRSADAVVTYPWYEPFGIVPLEAMACGVPVVASDVGGMRDTVRHGVTGVRVRPRSPGRLGRELVRLLDSPAVAARMGEAGARRVRRRYAWSRVAGRTAQLYAEIVAGRDRRRAG